MAGFSLRRQLHFKVSSGFGGGECRTWPHPEISSCSYTSSTPGHSGGDGRLCCWVEIDVQTATHPPNCSVNLLSSLFKSLSSLRALSIFSTECKTVVWCLPPNWRPISGREASVRCLARYMAICRG